MSIQEIAKKIAVENNLIKAEKYDMFLRDFDNMVEVIGLVQDPNYSMKEFEGREMLFPKRWLTLGVFDAATEVKA